MSDVVQGPWVKARPPYLFHYVRLRTEEQLGWLERLLLANEIYARSMLELNPVFNVRTMEYNTWHVEPGPGPCPRMEPGQPGEGVDSSGPTRDRFAHLGVVCLSEHQNSVAVWRNQGDRQRGACIRFATTGLASVKTALLPVHYAQDASVIGKVLGPELAWTTRAVLTKPPGLKDEAEWRWLLPARAGTHVKIDPLMIDGVVLGSLMPDGLRARVRQIVSQRRAPTALYQAKIDPETLQVAVLPIV
ncbi:hypothetical protein EGY25_03195 [Brevundimonas intermedia]|uniref:DUF2971 domain-containing protein n=1 Tax=Brevundimonas intermedia TaxID=74315 RepID=A0A4Y9RYX8_9CAUL|nr:hypothetical protein [Brevundimonas intermedia]TFW14222.1 hypothetical protein EGY25_03195 [Brevundimonas intermedia]